MWCCTEMKRFCAFFFVLFNSLYLLNAKPVKLLSWNLQAFFDGVTDGNEYELYKGSKSKWNEDCYKQRLKKLCDAIKTIEADVIVLLELENAGQLYDITNILNTGFNVKKYYKYGAFSKGKGCIGCGILSRYELSDFSLVSMDIFKESFINPPVRPLLQCDVKTPEGSFTLIANHWKSSGEENSLFTRCYQEKLLSDLIASLLKSGKGVAACGDFNRDIFDFDFSDDGQVFLSGGGKVKVKSVLINDGKLIKNGSYVYKNRWNCIDNIFIAGSIEATGSNIEDCGPWADDKGQPLAYKVWENYGWSDHLPVSVYLQPISSSSPVSQLSNIREGQVKSVSSSSS